MTVTAIAFPVPLISWSDLHVVVVHAAAAGRRGLLLRLLRDQRFGRQHHRSDRRGVLQRAQGRLDRIHHVLLHQVALLLDPGVVRP